MSYKVVKKPKGAPDSAWTEVRGGLTENVARGVAHAVNMNAPEGFPDARVVDEDTGQQVGSVFNSP
jgi:hypothetical protein